LIKLAEMPVCGMKVKAQSTGRENPRADRLLSATESTSEGMVVYEWTRADDLGIGIIRRPTKRASMLRASALAGQHTPIP